MILLEDLLAGAAPEGARVVGGVFSREFEGFAHDSRNVRGGEMFVAVRTERADGHDFIAHACQHGAAGVLCERPSDAATLNAWGATCVAVRDTRAALRAWARYVMRRQAPLVIGITGSVGKTCTTKAIAALLRLVGGDPRALFENDNFNDLFGLPISLSRLVPAHQTAVLELASDGAGEIASLCEIVAPQWGVVTNIAPAHLQHFGTVERLAHEYRALAEATSERLFLNADDPLVAGIAEQMRHAPSEIIWYGLGESADARATNVRTDLTAEQERPQVTHRQRSHSLAFRLHWRGASAEVQLQLVGRHNVYTALAAAAVALAGGVPLQEVAAALPALEPPAGRLRPFRGRNGSLIPDDTSSASFPSTLAALDALAASPPPRMAVLGEVSGGDLTPWPPSPVGKGEREGNNGGWCPPFPALEGGGMRGAQGAGPRERVRSTGYHHIGEAAARWAEYFIAVGDGAAEAARAAVGAGLPAERVVVTHTVEDTVLHIQSWLPATGPPATVLVKGAEAARLERVVERLLDDPETHLAGLVRQAPGAKQVVPLHQDRAAWMEVDLGAIAGNLRRLCEIAAPAEVMAVLKADAYGHGAVRVARTAVQHGATMLGTAVLSEAAALRAHGISAPILVLGYTPPWQAREVARLDVAVCLYALDLAQSLSRAAMALQRPPVAVHLKVDTGMHRLGLLPHEVVPFARQLTTLPGIRIEGLFTHFATADDADLPYAQEQLARFQQVLAEWDAARLPQPRYVHAANSAATLRLPESRFDLVRTGIALFGLQPSGDTPLPPGFSPALALKTQLAQVHDLPAGEPVSYGATWVTTRPSRIGVLPIGYADGFRRAPAHWGEVLVRGQRAPLVGRVCMDMCMVDVTDVPGARAGDEVVLIGQQGDERITAEEVASRLGTINYEVVSQILARVPREIASH
ncbi:MAG: alanine racemase [Chloroflexota bacterium]